LPFQATYYLNGHSFIEQELKKAQVAFRKNDNAFVAIDDVAALQAAADRLSPQIIQKQLDYWTLILGPKFSRAERHQINLSRFYAIGQVEYCRNFIF
jgi:exopolysaccharide biosynthesis predicted pyruvyltransferase EpsI